MRTIEQTKEKLNYLLDELNKEDKYKYYCVYYLKDRGEDDKIEAIAFKFPTFEEMCFEDSNIEKQMFINENFIHILDMRVFFREKPLSSYMLLNNNYQYITTKEELMGLLNSYLKSKERKNIDIYSTLTPTERIALESICAAIGLEGEISISKLIQNTNASRITFNNLLNTLSANGSAEVVSRGVKGTYIKFTDLELISHLGQK